MLQTSLGLQRQTKYIQLFNVWPGNLTDQFIFQALGSTTSTFVVVVNYT